jgi:DNA-binding GntR family transcriptional regulator
MEGRMPWTHHKSTADFATAAIKQMILTGELKPGMRVDQNEMAKTLDVSRHPVRQAIERLAERGFVQSRPHKSVIVSELSLDDMRCLYALRQVNEDLAMRLAWPRYDANFLIEAEALVDAMDRAIQIEDLDLYMVHNNDFHMHFYRPSRNSHAVRVIESLFQLSERYQRTALMSEGHAALIPGARSAQAQSEHRAMLQAVRTGDVDHLIGLCAAHNNGTMDAVASRLFVDEMNVDPLDASSAS